MISTDIMLELNNYYPYGMQMGQPENPQFQPCKYTGKEFEPTAGLNWLDFHARWYDPALLRTTTQDPAAAEYPAHSLYLWCAANPVNFVDRNGKRFFLFGKEKTKAIDILKRKTSMTLIEGDEDEILAFGTPITDLDKLLMQIIEDENVFVGLNAVNDKLITGGSFLGSQVVEGKTYAGQIINPFYLEEFDLFYEMPLGTSVFHELLEAYFGGLESPNSPPATGQYDSKGNQIATSEAYIKAHTKAKQTDPTFIEPDISIDKKNNEVWISKTGLNGELIEKKISY